MIVAEPQRSPCPHCGSPRTDMKISFVDGSPCRVCLPVHAAEDCELCGGMIELCAACETECPRLWVNDPITNATNKETK
jgi:hypothetical protein